LLFLTRNKLFRPAPRLSKFHLVPSVCPVVEFDLVAHTQQ
jgi:hypothetical protein